MRADVLALCRGVLSSIVVRDRWWGERCSTTRRAARDAAQLRCARTTSTGKAPRPIGAGIADVASPPGARRHSRATASLGLPRVDGLLMIGSGPKEVFDAA